MIWMRLLVSLDVYIEQVQKGDDCNKAHARGWEAVKDLEQARRRVRERSAWDKLMMKIDPEYRDCNLTAKINWRPWGYKNKKDWQMRNDPMYCEHKLEKYQSWNYNWKHKLLRALDHERAVATVLWYKGNTLAKRSQMLSAERQEKVEAIHNAQMSRIMGIKISGTLCLRVDVKCLRPCLGKHCVAI